MPGHRERQAAQRRQGAQGCHLCPQQNVPTGDAVNYPDPMEGGVRTKNATTDGQTRPLRRIPGGPGSLTCRLRQGIQHWPVQQKSLTDGKALGWPAALSRGTAPAAGVVGEQGGPSSPIHSGDSAWPLCLVANPRHSKNRHTDQCLAQGCCQWWFLGEFCGGGGTLHPPLEP